MVTLSEVNVESVTLKEFVEFVDKVREEFPMAYKVLQNRMLVKAGASNE